MGVEPSSVCAQLEHLADLLRNRVNSQWNPSIYEVWRPKIVEDIEKQMVRQLCWDGKVPAQGPRCPQPGTCHRILGGELDHQLPPLTEQGGQPDTRRDLDTGCRWGE